MNADFLDDRAAEQRYLQRIGCKPELPALTPSELPPEWHFLWDERSAIREYDGGYPREQAEMLALQEVIELMRQAGEL